MVATPSVPAVRAVITTSLDDTQVRAMIDDAILIVEDCPAVVLMSDAQQAAIVKWVAAHLIASTAMTGQVVSKRLGDASETYARATLGTGLSGTFYGQQALLLDRSGCLARVGKSRAFVKVL